MPDTVPTPPGGDQDDEDDISWWQPDEAERTALEAAVREADEDDPSGDLPHEVVVKEILEPMMERLRLLAEKRGQGG